MLYYGYGFEPLNGPDWAEVLTYEFKLLKSGPKKNRP